MSLFAKAQSTSISTSKNTVDLPFGEINVLVMTDVHSWVGGHGHNSPHQNVDYGSVLSFYQRLKEYCRIHNHDLWFVNNGDWIDGTGLAINGNIESLVPILEKMPWDAMNVGNHELYQSRVVEAFMRPGGFVEWWGERYLSSNVLYNQQPEGQPPKPLGQRYRYLRGQNATVLTMGFLYNMANASPLITVETVENVVQEQWFVDVVSTDSLYDAIMIVAHMDVRDELVTVILDQIRSLVGNQMPVQFITGHTHYRGFQTFDETSVSFEAGRFLDTIGFVSFPKKQHTKASSNRKLQETEQEGGEGEEGSEENKEKGPPLLGPGGIEWQNVSEMNEANTISPTMGPTIRPTRSPTVSGNTTSATATATTTSPTLTPTTQLTAPNFSHKFIDSDVTVLESILGISDLATEDGTALSEFISRTRQELGLLELVGCAPGSYFLNRGLSNDDSLWRLFLNKVAPSNLLKVDPAKTRSRVFLGSSGGWRYDIIQGNMLKDDVIAVAPFNDTLISLSTGIPGSTIKELMAYLNRNPNPDNLLEELDNFVASPSMKDLKSNEEYDIIAPEFALPEIMDGLDEIKYNGTVSRKESGFSNTNVWLDYVRSNWKCKQHQIDAHEKEHGSSSHHNSGSSPSSPKPGNSGTHTIAGTPYNPGGADEDDKFYVTLAIVGVGLVLVLGTVYIIQLHKSYTVRYKNRQRIMMLADAEHDNELI